jgi:cysteine desulfurase
MTVDKYVYFDYMATTPVDPIVVEKMCEYLGPSSHYGNPASTHYFGQVAKSAVEKAREQVANAINATVDEIVWTSGATESDNLAIKGAARFYSRKGKHLITLKTEHKAVLDSFKALEGEGFEVSYLDVESNGLVSMSVLEEAIRPETILVSIMHVNNEIGVIQPIQAIGAMLRDKGILFHVDAAQSTGKLPIDVNALGVDLMSFSGHKVYGPKGIGVLYVRHRPRVRLKALIHGGGHEGGLRSGTLPTHQCVGMGAAFELADTILETETKHLLFLNKRLLKGLNKLKGIKLNGSEAERVPHNLSISFERVDGEALLYALNELCVSTSSACSSASIEPSYVLKAIGLSDRLAHSTIRFSLGRFTTEEEIDFAIKTIVYHVNRLRALAL